MCAVETVLQQTHKHTKDATLIHTHSYNTSLCLHGYTELHCDQVTQLVHAEISCMHVLRFVSTTAAVVFLITIDTKCDVANVVSDPSISILKLHWWLPVAE